MTTHSPEALRASVAGLMTRAKTDLAELVAFQSVADPRQYPASECLRAAQWVADAFIQAGISETGLHETPDGSLAVIGSRPAPPGAPTVLLYSHYDVQPPVDEAAWTSPVWTLTEREGRWYGRGAADCKGNIVAILTALRAAGPQLPVGVTIVAEGSEEQGTGGLERFVEHNPDLLRANTIVICDSGNFAAGVPTLTETLRGTVNVVVTVETLASTLHSGMYGGGAPDALAALIRLLDSLRDASGDAAIEGLRRDQRWDGIQYPPARFRADAGVLPGVDLPGSGTIADRIWARPAVTVLGIDAPPVIGSAAAIPPVACARINLRIPPGISPDDASAALTTHLHKNIPWSARLTIQPEAAGAPFAARGDGPARLAMTAALETAFGKSVTAQGQGGSIPLCTVLAETYPGAEILLLGVEEPQCLIHAPNESVDPAEIERIALALAIFLTSSQS